MLTRRFVLWTASSAALALTQPSRVEATNPPHANKQKQAAGSAAGFRLTVEYPEAPVSASDSILVMVALQNATNQPLSYIERLGAMDLDVSVTDEKGQVCPLTRYGKWAKELRDAPVSGRRFLQPLDPQEATEWPIRLDRLYDMTLAGTYTVVVSRAVPPHEAVGNHRMAVAAVDVACEPFKVRVAEYDVWRHRPAPGREQK
jgi:hypothetical protein